MSKNYIPLASELRPNYFKDFIHNEHIVTVLQRMLSTDKVPNGFLLSGIRGIGKTTLARIVARTINCTTFPTGEACGICESCVESLNSNHPDIREIDGGSHGNIEDIRRILDEAALTPMLSNYKVFIVDEAHNLGRSQASWDSLLKILEEPPSHVIWLFCTTAKHKIPETIKSRLVSLDLRAAPTTIIAQHLSSIIRSKFSVDESRASEVAWVIASASSNSIRDSLTLLEKVYPYCQEQGWNASLVRDSLGILDQGIVHASIDKIINKDFMSLWASVQGMLDDGIDPDLIVTELFVKPINTLMSLSMGGSTDQDANIYMGFLQRLGIPRIKYMAEVLIHRETQMAQSTNKKTALQLICMEIAA